MSDVHGEDAVQAMRAQIAATLENFLNDAAVDWWPDTNIWADCIISDLGLEHVGWFVRFPSGIEAINLTPFQNDSDMGKQEPVFRAVFGRQLQEPE